MKIAVCGSAPSSISTIPFRDASYEQWSNKTQQFPTPKFAGEDWQVWGCSPGLWAHLERADRWFETHRWEPGAPWFSPEYVSFLRRFRGPVYTGGPVPEIANHVVYPLERVEAEFSSYFLHSSVSLMAALAILEIEDRRKARAAERVRPEVTDKALLEEDDGDDVIGFYGVDMAATEEYGDQRSGCHFFILEALRRGIGVYVPQESCLLRPQPVYGISEWDHSYIKATARARELNTRKGQAEQQLQELMKTANFMAGAIDNHNYWIKTWVSPYGLPAGLVLRHTPGTGLGGGITLPRPFSPPPTEVIAEIEDRNAAAASFHPVDVRQPAPVPEKAKRRSKAKAKAKKRR